MCHLSYEPVSDLEHDTDRAPGQTRDDTHGHPCVWGCVRILAPPDRDRQRLPAHLPHALQAPVHGARGLPTWRESWSIRLLCLVIWLNDPSKMESLTPLTD